MGESAELTSSQQEAEDHLQQSRQAIQDLQAALRNAQVGHAQATTTRCVGSLLRRGGVIKG